MFFPANPVPLPSDDVKVGAVPFLVESGKVAFGREVNERDCVRSQCKENVLEPSRQIIKRTVVVKAMSALCASLKPRNINTRLCRQIARYKRGDRWLVVRDQSAQLYCTVEEGSS